MQQLQLLTRRRHKKMRRNRTVLDRGFGMLNALRHTRQCRSHKPIKINTH